MIGEGLAQNSLRKIDSTETLLTCYVRDEHSISRKPATMRMSDAPIAAVSPQAIKGALIKVIGETFEYFNTEPNKTMIKILIADIRQMYKLHSPFEIISAIETGRRNKEDLYGKLNATHFMEWIRLADEATTYNISSGVSSRENNERDEVEAMYFVDGKFIFQDALDKMTKPEKPELSNEEKATAAIERYGNKSESDLRREHSRAWKLEEHGEYKAYMDGFE